MQDFESRQSRIVIGVDFSPSSIAAAQWAARWMSADSEVVLVHSLVIPDVSGALAKHMPLPSSLLATARAGAARRLKELSALLGKQPALIEVREGRPADVIAEVAREYEATMIVVGKHGEAGVQRGYTGRTTDHLVRTSPASVLVVSGLTEGIPGRMIVPLTYSSITPHIIEWTKRLYELSRAEVIAIHVIGSAVLGHVMSMSAIKSGKDLTPREIDAIFREDRDRWRNELLKAGIPKAKASAEVVFGEVSDAVLSAAKEHKAEMIVMGSHAGPLRRLLLGSAASAVLRQADIPVMVVVEPEAKEPEKPKSTESNELLAVSGAGGGMFK